MKDMDDQLIHEERHILSNGQPNGMDGRDQLLYADDTLILARSKQAAKIMLRKIRTGRIKQIYYDIESKKVHTVRDDLPGECSVSRRRNHACLRWSPPPRY